MCEVDQPLKLTWGTATKRIDVTALASQLATSPIIGYIHVCQKRDWRKSFDLVWNALVTSGLYAATAQIRVGVVFDKEIDMDIRLQDPKIKIVASGPCSLYERLTLYHMKDSSHDDLPTTRYFYMHTKGISHWGTPREPFVLAWICVLLDCVTKHWQWADSVLRRSEADVYGCMYRRGHIVTGNFWWTTARHIRTLPNIIASNYIGPEVWICVAKNIKVANTFPDYNCYFTMPPAVEHKLEIHNHTINVFRHFQFWSLSVLGKR